MTPSSKVLQLYHYWCRKAGISRWLQLVQVTYNIIFTCLICAFILIKRDWVRYRLVAVKVFNALTTSAHCPSVATMNRCQASLHCHLPTQLNAGVGLWAATYTFKVSSRKENADTDQWVPTKSVYSRHIGEYNTKCTTPRSSLLTLTAVKLHWSISSLVSITGMHSVGGTR